MSTKELQRRNISTHSEEARKLWARIEKAADQKKQSVSKWLLDAARQRLDAECGKRELRSTWTPVVGTREGDAR